MTEMIRDLPDDDRPRERLARLGPAALSNAELLALFIGSGTPGTSAIGIARQLLKHFGSLRALSSASVPALKSQRGIGIAKATLLSAAFELGVRAAREQAASSTLDSPERIYELLAPELAHLDREHLVVAMLNNRLRHLATEHISVGTLTETVAHPREILRPVLTHNAYGFILLHNHPSGDPSPSKADVHLTRRIHEAAQLMQVNLIDHLIIGQPSPGRQPYYSFREAGLLSS